MGGMLRDALRTTCVQFGWSYAVFWRIVDSGGDSRRLLWEEGHLEPSKSSDFLGSSGYHAMNEWEVMQDNCDEGIGINNKFSQRENKVYALLEKKVKHQVHFIGRGIIGRAALTCNHQWICCNEFGTEAFTSEDFKEINDQISVGIQTIAIIPVLPHGVIQLGSFQMIMQDMLFVDHVRGLFVEFGFVPGVLLSEINLKRISWQTVRENNISEAAIPTEQPQNNNARPSKVVDFTQGSCSDQGNKISSSNQISQFSHSFVPEEYNSELAIFPNVESNNDILLSGSHSMVTPFRSLSSMQKNAASDSCGLSNVDVVVNQEYRFHDSSNLTTLKQPVFCNIGLQGSADDIPISGNNKTPNIGPEILPNPSYSRGFTTKSLLGRNESSLNGNTLDSGNFVAFQDNMNSKDGHCINNADLIYTTTDSMLNDTRIQGDNQLFSRDTTTVSRNSLIESTTEKQKIEDDPFQLLRNPLESSKSHFSESFPGLESIQNCVLRNFDHCQGRQKWQADLTGQNDIATERSNIYSKTVRIPTNTSNKINSDVFVEYPLDSDLYDALGLDRIPSRSIDSLDSLFGTVYTKPEGFSGDVSTSTTHLNPGSTFEATHCSVPRHEIFTDMDHDELLDAVVSKVHSRSIYSMDDNISCKTTLTNASSSVIADPPNQYQIDSTGKMVFGTSSIGIENNRSIPVSSCSFERTGDSSLVDGVYKSQISMWVENNQNMKNESTLSSNCKRDNEADKVHRKRSKPGENPRPRPKDRQMIQDRVKELREIVPNGAKCSIDALLERTIKHMCFLQCVTKHADKLKETGEPTIINKGLVLKDNFEGGATWAFEVGSQSMICPIIVEDLNPPRQLLVEMLCEDRGFFLEIADLIKGLGLTILKGVMEARNDKVWARFAVEAYTDVTRMNIFLSLVQLLEPNAVTQQGVANMNMNTNIVNIPSTNL
ncbi:hypothetical protein ZOSMA_93G00220 [Zostera marina]|uniref:BHLH domain-containing protein n=1 Tax=Zostera marina TaxID=29655 RepID=A0A0K9NIV4_ZOSMR|nr:hypothetical protein ZOSMA_93G00220 [Zostera marina]